MGFWLLAALVAGLGGLSGRADSVPAAPFDLQKFIDTELKAGKKRIVVPPGRYRVVPRQSGHLCFKDLTNTVIVASGVEMICTETARAVNFENCRDLRFEGMTIDYDPLPFTEGRITALAPDKKSPDWSGAKTFAQEVCRRLATDHPDRFVTTMAKKDRGGRIFLDYLRNDRMATAVAPLSPRAREGATVSMPVDWSQLRAGLDPRQFTVRSAPALLRKNRPWKDYAKSAKPLRRAIEQLLKTR